MLCLHMRPQFLRNFSLPPLNADVLYEWQFTNTLVHKYQKVFFAMNRSAQKEQFAHIFVAFKKMCVTDVGCTANPVLHQIVAFLRIVLCTRPHTVILEYFNIKE